MSHDEYELHIGRQALLRKEGIKMDLQDIMLSRWLFRMRNLQRLGELGLREHRGDLAWIFRPAKWDEQLFCWQKVVDELRAVARTRKCKPGFCQGQALCLSNSMDKGRGKQTASVFKGTFPFYFSILFVSKSPPSKIQTL